MKNPLFKLAAIALALAFAFGCSNDTNSNPGGADPALNGEWLDEYGGITKLNNGTAEASLNGVPMVKGIYTTSGSNITITVTSATGAFFAMAGYDDLDSARWYSKNELSSKVDPQMLNKVFSTETEIYSITGNTLMWGQDRYIRFVSSGPATTLEGTWSGVAGDGFKFFNDGTFEASDEGIPSFKGTYTTSGNSITITATHYHGSIFPPAAGFESRWYSIAELIALGISPDVFAPMTGTYLISGNSLILTLLGETSYYTKVS